jgi:uncharacterized protein (TIGR02246 family)
MVGSTNRWHTGAMTSFEDYNAIRVLTARYNRAADEQDLEGFAACFTDDGIFEIEGLVTLQGCEAVKGMIANLAFPTHHMTTDPVIEVDGDRATQTCSFVLFGRREGDNQMQVLTTSRYEDDLVRTPDGWRFAKRVSRTDNDLGLVLAEIHPPLLEALASLA